MVFKQFLLGFLPDFHRFSVSASGIFPIFRPVMSHFLSGFLPNFFSRFLQSRSFRSVLSGLIWIPSDISPGISYLQNSVIAKVIPRKKNQYNSRTAIEIIIVIPREAPRFPLELPSEIPAEESYSNRY